jgi:hypothetical protein
MERMLWWNQVTQPKRPKHTKLTLAFILTSFAKSNLLKAACTFEGLTLGAGAWQQLATLRTTAEVHPELAHAESICKLKKYNDNHAQCQ